MLAEQGIGGEPLCPGPGDRSGEGGLRRLVGVAIIPARRGQPQSLEDAQAVGIEGEEPG